MLRAAAVLGMAAGAGGQELVFKEPYPDKLHDVHTVLLVVPTVCVIAAVIGTSVVWRRSTVRLTVVLALAIWALLVSVGIAAWSVTYVTSREAILAKAELSIVAAAGRAERSVVADLTVATSILKTITSAAGEGQVNISGVWPEQHMFINRILRTVGTRTDSLSAASMSAVDGVSSSVQVLHRNRHGTRIYMHYIRDATFLPPWARCKAADWQDNCTNMSAPDACSDPSSTAARECPLSCSFTEFGTQNCYGADMVAFHTVLASERKAFDPSVLTHSIFAEPAEADRNVVNFETGAHRNMPWYNLSYSRVPAFSEPYVNPRGKLVSMVIGGVFDDNGVRLGYSQVYIVLPAVTAFMQGLNPFANGFSMLLTTKAYLVGSSLTDEELRRQAGNSKAGIDLVLVHQFERDSAILRTVLAVESRWGGSLGNAMHGNALYQEVGQVVVSFPVRVPGFPLLLVVSIPIAEILGTADNASMVSLALSLCIGGGFALLVAAGLAVVLMPLSALQGDMHKAAVMQLDPCSRRMSRVTEMRAMQVSFGVVVRQLIEYRQYLPQSVLVTDEESTVLEGSPTSRVTKSSSSSGRHVCLQLEQPVGTILTCMPKSRNVTLLVTNLKGFFAFCNNMGIDDLDSAHATYLQKAVLSVNKHSGIVDEFVGDKLHASFNTRHSSMLHRTNGVECMKDLLRSLPSDTEPIALSEANAAASSGRALCGTMGCRGLKRYSIVGPCAALVWKLERWGRMWGVPQLVDDTLARDCASHFELRKVAKVRLSASHEEFVYELAAPKPVKGGLRYGVVVSAFWCISC